VTKLEVQTIPRRISVISEPLFNEEQSRQNIYNTTVPEVTADDTAILASHEIPNTASQIHQNDLHGK
jgi:hypothetical protein